MNASKSGRHLINLWAAPRTSSTSLMYSFAQRKDTAVVDEPLYAAYLARHPHVERSYRDELMRVQPSNIDTVVKALLTAPRAPASLLFAKHIAKQAAFDEKSFAPLLNQARSNVLLIREPRRVLASWFATMGSCDLHESAFDALEQSAAATADAVVQQEDLCGAPKARCVRCVPSLDCRLMRRCCAGRAVGGRRTGCGPSVWYPLDARADQLRRGCRAAAAHFPPAVGARARAVRADLCAAARRAHRAIARAARSRATPTLSCGSAIGLVPRADARVSVFDSSVQGGDAVWEGLRVTNGRIFALDEHLDRLFASAHALAFERVPSKPARGRRDCATLRANGCATALTFASR
jgi:hypothetical protein